MKVIKTTTKDSYNFIETKETIFLDNNMDECVWEWVSRKNYYNAVIIVPIYKDNRLVVKSEYRIPINDLEWGFPAGFINKGETPLNAAKRELFEETGLTATGQFRPTSPLIYSSVGLTDIGIYIVYLDCYGDITSKFQDTTEDINIYLMNRIDIEILLKEKKKFGAKSWLIMNEYANGGLIYENFD